MLLFEAPILAVALYLTFVPSLRLEDRDINARILDCYDFIIVGGGVSGLVVANHLTEDPSVTVLVLEAGPLDNYEETILYPIDSGYGLGTKYDWNLWTAPQTSLNGRGRPYDTGRGVGGGSLINGMCWTRGGRADYDAWEALGNPGWGWDGMLPYFKKTENYTDNVDADFSKRLYTQPDPSFHGTDGYVHVSYPRYFYNQSRLNELGIPILKDPNNGFTAGGMLIPNNINPDNQTRSTARLAYLDGFIDRRPNLQVVTNQHVYRLIMDSATQQSQPQTSSPKNHADDRWVSGVQFIPDGTLSIHNVTCSREVILAAGAVHTPQILEFSGIGDPNVLNKFTIPTKIKLPGVGNNFQDHPYLGVVYYGMQNPFSKKPWSTLTWLVSNMSYLTLSMIYKNPTLLSQDEQEYYVNKTGMNLREMLYGLTNSDLQGPWTAGAINTVAFPSLPSISKNWTNMIADAESQSPTAYLLPNLDPTIIAGYQAQKDILVNLLGRSDVSAYEILSDNIGLLSVAAVRTLSRGHVHMQDTNPFMQPLIDPRFCSNPLDCQVIVEGLLFNNRLINTSSMRQLGPAPYYPFLQVATPEMLMPAVRSGIRTEFHGAGSTSMLPLEHGGVVDSHLRVYGTKNLRIVDGGIMPLVPATHLQAPVYAIAEKAADIIKAHNLLLHLQSCGRKATSRVELVVSNSSIGKLTPKNSSVSRLPTPSTFQQLVNISAFMPFINSTSSNPLKPSSTPQTLPLAEGMLQASNLSAFRQISNTLKVTGNPVADVMSILFAQSSTTLTSFPAALPTLFTNTVRSNDSALGRTPISSPLLALLPTAIIPKVPLLSVDNAALADLAPSLLAEVKSLHDSATSYAAKASQPTFTALDAPVHSDWEPSFDALPRELFAAGHPLHEILSFTPRKRDSDIGPQDEDNCKECEDSSEEYDNSWDEYDGDADEC
ncbi:Dehydrogenase [Lachnellula subtilissima]|uniref:Dehydrogenase n=1 Tax=Lachnellula subtilissima TaxID=602034 RepID=A0A8H8RQG0_9HELO|nr:Dehydrogenase [Lachnellula subtilissima]